MNFVLLKGFRLKVHITLPVPKFIFQLHIAGLCSNVKNSCNYWKSNHLAIPALL